MNLYGCCDVLVSLHRSEGFGRVIAECIILGLEIITTNWGGNTDFVAAHNLILDVCLKNNLRCLKIS